MADIVIRGMEKPKTCFMCPFMFARSYCSANLEIEFNDENYSELLGRHKDCPLLPLPEGHGRLVDAEEIRTRLSRKLTACKPGTIEELTFAASIDIVDHADTIVPAEGGTDDG